MGLVADRNGMRWRRRGSQAVQTERWPAAQVSVDTASTVESASLLDAGF